MTQLNKKMIRNKNNKSFFRLTAYVLCLQLFFLSSCGYKKVVGFNKQLKNVDTLVIVPPILNLECAGAEKGETNYDTLLMNKIDRVFYETYTTLLSEKYHIEKVAHVQAKPDTSTLSLLRTSLRSMEKSKKKLKKIEIDPSLFEQYSSPGSRYFMFSYIEGIYRSKKSVKEVQRLAATLMIATAILSGGRYIINSSFSSNCTLFWFVYDKQEKKVLVYRKSDRCTEDIWQKTTLEQLARRACMKLYYK